MQARASHTRLQIEQEGRVRCRLHCEGDLVASGSHHCEFSLCTDGSRELPSRADTRNAREEMQQVSYRL